MHHASLDDLSTYILFLCCKDSLLYASRCPALPWLVLVNLHFMVSNPCPRTLSRPIAKDCIYRTNYI